MTEPLRVYSWQDPAVDQKRSRIDDYKQTQDPKFLTFVEGRRPMVFSVVDLDYPDYKDCEVFITQPGIAADRAFRYAVVAIEGVRGLTPDGGAWRPNHERVREGEPVKTITVADMRAIFKAIAPRHINNVGLLILQRAEMEREGNAVGGAG